MYAAARDVTENRILTTSKAALRRVATLVGRGPRRPRRAVRGRRGRSRPAAERDATRLLRYEDGTADVVGSLAAPRTPTSASARQPGLDRGQLWGGIAQSRSPERTDRLGDRSDAVP